jgi:hypothetical protein
MGLLAGKRGNRRFSCTLRLCRDETFTFARKRKVGKRATTATGFARCALAAQPEKVQCRCEPVQNSTQLVFQTPPRRLSQTTPLPFFFSIPLPAQRILKTITENSLGYSAAPQTKQIKL